MARHLTGLWSLCALWKVCEAEKILLVFPCSWLYTNSFHLKFLPVRNLMGSVFELLPLMLVEP